MRKRKSVIFLVCCILLLICFVTTACVIDGNDENKIQLEYISSSNIIMWRANWAERFALIVYFGESSDGLLIYNESDIPALDNHRRLGQYYEQSGKYFIIVLAYKGTEVVRETMVIDVEVDYNQQYPEDEYFEPSDTVEGYKSDIGKLKKVYNHLAKSDNDLSIVLANQNGVKSVSGYTLSQYGDYSYDKESNTLTFSSRYFKKFSSGARLSFDVEYEDGRNDTINVEIVDVMPMEIIKGGISITGSQVYSNNINGVISILNLAFNYDIFLGYDRQVASQGSADYVKNVSIDGKRLLSTTYTLSSKESKIILTANKSLSGLSTGMHLLEIYTIYGKSEVWLNVRGKTTAPVNVKIDYDSAYPNIYISWDMLRNDAEEYIVRIGDNDYSSKDYPQLFEGCKFDATGKIKYNDEVRVSSVIDGTSETSVGAVILDVDISNQAIQGYLSYDKSFEYLGTTYNTFIDNYDELKDLVFYSLIHYNKLTNSTNSNYEKMWKIYVNPSFVGSADALEKSIKAAEEYFNEAVKSTWLVKGGYINIYELHFTVSSTCIPDNVVRTSNIKENLFNDTHFSSTGRSGDYDDFAVNDLKKIAEVTYSEELYLALERGVRPIPKQGSPAQAVYEKAKTILRKIIDDGMNDYQKVHAIVDWLSSSVTYNWALSEEISKTSVFSEDYKKFYSYREFYLEGAILDGLAVCNGYAKAVSLLCGIEGITCYKVKGGSGKGEGTPPNISYPQHAWNKVYIGGSWYIVDSTWANEKYKYTANSQTYEVLKHNTLFMTDEQSGNKKDGAHYECYLGDYSGYFAGSPYDVFANTYFMYDGNVYDMVIESKSELEILLKYLAEGKGKNMGRSYYLSVDVRCNNKLLSEYLSSLKGEGLSIFSSYSVTTKYNNSYGSMTSLIFCKL